jgi:hypothetical protein
MPRCCRSAAPYGLDSCNCLYNDVSTFSKELSMTVHRKLSALALALPLVLACAAAPAHAGEQDFDGALQSYRSGRMADAYGRFLALGLHGDPDAARVALFLGENGELLHNAQWELTADDAAALRKVAQRPSLRTQTLTATGWDATGIAQRPAFVEKLAGD